VPNSVCLVSGDIRSITSGAKVDSGEPLFCSNLSNVKLVNHIALRIDIVRCCGPCNLLKLRACRFYEENLLYL
jgi:hypothetical protein